MGRRYTAEFHAVAVTAVQDFFSILTPAGCSGRLLSIDISQYSDFGDAQDELLSWNIKRGATSAGSGGSAPTPSPVFPGDSASICTTRANDTTVANTGTIIQLWSSAFNVRAGLIWTAAKDYGDLCLAPSTRLVIGLAVAPADSLTMNGTILFEET